MSNNPLKNHLIVQDYVLVALAKDDNQLANLNHQKYRCLCN